MASAATKPEYEDLRQFFANEILHNKLGTGKYFFNGYDKVAGFYHLSGRDVIVISSINDNEVFRGINKLTGLISYIIIGSNEEISNAQDSLYVIMESSSALSEEYAASTEEIASLAQSQNASFQLIETESAELQKLSVDLNHLINKFVV